ncbi:Na/Pi cotransporter family protein [Parahaliea aestuarii]|uniref:Na/Pi cotransporter family protein n=1 Tax=Parahaliea aestuarii TaxID=1852021 RepID=A0A5C8ZZZ5_9GAMM|nr:Na/Pi symporter [Parahaliea aestuarii]TXS93202.1 Na/Pi cotransporter family protein [Parahaliea aestuarii]
MWPTISALLGGLGLLLIGMSMMTDGLKLAAGNSLSGLLARWTHTRLRGLGAGLLITAVVQSSSAVTVATIGFANAGILSLERAIWVIFGSNVGTTMTAWIVALVGFKLDIEAFALPLVGIGALLKMAAGHSRRSSYGVALIGFALLFLGIGTLKSAFEGLATGFALPGVDTLTMRSLLLYVAIGFGLTALMQSSSAAMVVALSAAESGLVELNAAAAVVIGANLGTTSTALLTMIGATANARRVALSHVAFNLVTAIVALLLLRPLLWLVAALQAGVDLQAGPAVTLAVFHTVFNLLGVMLMWPLSSWLVRQLSRCFRASEQRAARPRYLDRSTLGVPFTAVNSMALEIRRIALLASEGLLVSLRSGFEPPGRREDIQSLADAVGDFSSQLSRGSLTPLLVEAIEHLISALQRYMTLSVIAVGLQQLRASLDSQGFEGPSADAVHAFGRRVEAFVQAWQDGLEEGGQEALPDYAAIDRSHDEAKRLLLREATAGRLEIEHLDLCLQYLDEGRRACRQLGKASTRLTRCIASLERGESMPAPQQAASGE